MNMSFYLEHGKEYYAAWRSIQAPIEECGRGPTPEAAIIALLLAHPFQPGRALTEAEIALAEIEGCLKDTENTQGAFVALAIAENYFQNHPRQAA